MSPTTTFTVAAAVELSPSLCAPAAELLSFPESNSLSASSGRFGAATAATGGRFATALAAVAEMVESTASSALRMVASTVALKPSCSGHWGQSAK